MAKRIRWTISAKIGRRQILEFWHIKTGNKKYSKKISKEFNQRINTLKKYPKLGLETDSPPVRTTACGHFSIFYLDESKEIIILGIYDTRRDPEEIAQDIHRTRHNTR